MLENAQDDEIDLRSLLSALWSSRILILSLSIFAAAISVGYALYLPNIYQSSALLSPSQDTNSGMGGLLGQYGSLASMAGVTLP